MRIYSCTSKISIVLPAKFQILKLTFHYLITVTHIVPSKYIRILIFDKDIFECQLSIKNFDY